MARNVAEPERLQMTIWHRATCWICKATLSQAHARTQKYVILTALPQHCYVTCTVPVFFLHCKNRQNTDVKVISIQIHCAQAFGRDCLDDEPVRRKASTYSRLLNHTQKPASMSAPNGNQTQEPSVLAVYRSASATSDHNSSYHDTTVNGYHNIIKCAEHAITWKLHSTAHAFLH
jgi:hypothetical protein